MSAPDATRAPTPEPEDTAEEPERSTQGERRARAPRSRHSYQPTSRPPPPGPAGLPPAEFESWNFG